MSDTGFMSPPVPQLPVSFGEAMASLGSATPPAPQATVPTQPFVSNPVPPVTPTPATPADVVKDWHKDPIKQGVTQGFVQAYAAQMPGGLGQAAQHLTTYKSLVDSGKTTDDGGLWNKFRNSPERMSTSDSASLAERLRTVGNATQQSPDLRFDPVGRVARVHPDGAVRVDYPVTTQPSALDLRTLAPSGVDNLRRLAAIGQGAPAGAVGDALPGFLGTDTNHRPSGAQVGDLADGLQAVAGESGSSVEALAGTVAAGWNQIKVPTRPWEKPFAMTTNGPNPAAEALEDRLSTKLVQAMAAGVSSVNFEGGKDMSVTVTPDGGLSVSAHPTLRNAKLLRHLYPAFSKDGTTAWLPSVPAKVADVTKLNGHVATFNGPIMDQAGGHPGLTPGDHIMYDAPRGAKAPVPAQDLGPVLSTQPEFAMDRLGPNDIDVSEMTGGKSPLDTNAWALIPGGNALKTALTRKGFKPIQHTIGDAEHQLVFGIGTDEARKLAPTVTTNKGVWSGDEFRPGDHVSFDKAPDSVRSTTHLLAGDVHWFLSGVDRNADPTDEHEGEIQDTQVRSLRSVAKNVPDVTQAVAQLQAAGATNLRVYTHRNQLDGFKTAFEHIFTDGQNYASHLSSTPSSEGHVVPVFVPENHGVPGTPEQQPQSVRYGNTGAQLNGVSVLTQDKIKKLTDLKEKFLASTGDALVPSADPSGVRITGNRVVVDDPTVDSANTVRLARLAGASVQGHDPDRMDTADRQHAVTISGQPVPQLKRTRPDQSWADKHGVEFDPGWRSDGVKVIDPKLSNALSDTMSAFISQHGDAAKLWGLNRIAVTTGYDRSPAYTEWGKLGGAIGLSAKHFSDPARLQGQMADLHARGVIAGEGAQYPFQHELGHVVHGALQFGSDGSGARSQLLALRSRLGVAGIASGLSKQAAVSPEEMVAESVAARLSGHATPLANQVVGIVQAGLDRVLAARTKAPW